MVLTEQMTIPRTAQPYLPRPVLALPMPAEVELILSAIETGQHGKRERRYVARASYRVQATLRLYSDAPDLAPRVIYTRDINPRGLGFITQHRLPLGHGGVLRIIPPEGDEYAIACTLLRCREAAPNWFEGSLYFNRQQIEFAI